MGWGECEERREERFQSGCKTSIIFFKKGVISERKVRAILPVKNLIQDYIRFFEVNFWF